MWRVSRVGQIPDADPFVRREKRILDHGYNSPFEEFSIAMELSRKGIETIVNLFDGKPRDILAAIGPAISPCCYEVDEPVAAAFRTSGQNFESFATPDGPGKWRLDLVEANRRQLLRAGIGEANLEASPLCVSCEKDLFFSYRRDGGDTGRQMGFIMLNGTTFWIASGIVALLDVGLIYLAAKLFQRETILTRWK